MIRLYLFAEGQTEQTFADTILKPHLARYGVFMHNPLLIAHARKKGKVHRGGSGYGDYQPMKDDIMRLISQERDSEVFFTTMIDLYALHYNFPCLSESERFRQAPSQRVTFLETKFADDIGDRRFVPYIQLHEYEAYLFSNPNYFELLYENCREQVENLKVIAESYETPELINDGLETAPSKRIIAQFPSYKKSKQSDGVQLAELIGLNVIRDKCPHFSEWVSNLERLGG
jgi:hypothetical protein